MSRKKEPEHVNHERWLVSYADFITLLFAFFVVLFAASRADRKKQSELAAAMQTAFTPFGAFEAHSKTPPLDRNLGASTTGTPTPIQPPIPTSDSEEQSAKRTMAESQVEAQAEAEITAHIEKLLRETNSEPRLPPNSITVHSTREGLVISLHEAGFFLSGSAEVRPGSIALLRKLAGSLPMAPLRVEGHTDNVPIHTAQFASNWELSTARATTIAHLVLEHSNVSPADLSAAGYAEYHPATSNATVAGRAQNRRVDIILLRHPTP